MRQALRLHPDSLCSAVTRIEADVARPLAGVLVLTYQVSGRIGDLRMPSASMPARTDGLWSRTCFEAFVRSVSDEAYYEFNFAPSTEWAAYQFTAYRSGMRAAAEIGAPRIEVRSSAARYTLKAALDLDKVRLAADAPWRVGLAAVIEEESGNKSYWALAHPPGKPDFHHVDCFAHKLS